MRTSETVVFFGSGPVAAKSLALLRENFPIEAVITKPTTVREMIRAAGKSTPVHAVTAKSELDELVKSQHFSSKIGILIDFGIIVSRQTIDSFPLGILNSHFSLLPEWRGADPISFSILSGQEITGVSIMLLSEGMDEGPLVGLGEQMIEYNETTTTLTEKLINLSDALLQELIPEYLKQQKTISQEEAAQMLGRPAEPTYSRKLTKEDGRIDWQKPAVQIEREIRAFDIWPKSYTVLNGHELIIKNASVIQENGVPGAYHYDKKSLTVYCGKDALSIVSLQPAGKKEMPIQAFLAGYRL